MQNADYLIVPLLQGFEWFDESLQESLREAGWPQLTRPESMVMLHVQMDVVHPAEIARSLRLTRQAIHSTIAGMVARGIFALSEDPLNRRIKVVGLTAMGQAMRRDAQTIVSSLTAELTRRVGARHVAALRALFLRDWGEPHVVRLEADQAGAAAAASSERSVSAAR